jgi:hypothetical protein
MSVEKRKTTLLEKLSDCIVQKKVTVIDRRDTQHVLCTFMLLIIMYKSVKSLRMYYSYSDVVEMWYKLMVNTVRIKKDIEDRTPSR